MLRWLLPPIACALLGLAAAHGAPVLVAADGSIYVAGTAGDDVPSKSSDHGTTWRALHRDLYSAVGFAEDDEGAIYAATAYEGVFKSTDKGTSWKKVAPESVMRYMNSIAFANGTVYAASAGGILTSVDKGRTWKKSNWRSAAKQFAQETDGTVFVATDEGVAYATKNDPRWKRTSEFSPKGGTPTDPTTHSIAVRDAAIYAATIGSQVFRSTDKGATWAALSGGLPKSIAFSLWISREGEIYAGFIGGAVFKSTDKGATWARRAPLTSHVYGFTETKSGTLYAFCHDGVYMSTDKGSSWKRAQLPKRKAS